MVNSTLLKLRSGLDKTRKNVITSVLQAVSNRRVLDSNLLDELEEILLTADVGIKATDILINRLREKAKYTELSSPEQITSALKSEMIALLDDTLFDNAISLHGEGSDSSVQTLTKPHVILMVGVNGTGKTTTIGKLAYKYKQAGKKVLLSAADTFRAAAAEQLEIWAQRVGAEMIKTQHGADPASVAYDSLQAALSRSIDVLIVDTAGRLHTKVNLMEELRKIHRVLYNCLAGAPHEVLLVLDATTGQNAINQTKQFLEAIGLTGLVLTKLDGTAKGGIVLAIRQELGVPVKYIGFGETMEDLTEFDAEKFVEALFQ